MKIEVKYLSLLERVVGTEAEECELADGASTCELLDLLVEIHGDPLRQLLYSPDGRVIVSCLRNGKRIPSDAELVDGGTRLPWCCCCLGG